MDFLIVTDSKMKVSLSEEEMKGYGIRGDGDSYDDPTVKRAVRSILSIAKAKVGFCYSGEKLLVQVYPTKEGCELFVTKLGDISRDAERALTRSDRVALIRERCVLFKLFQFDEIDSILGIIRNRTESSFECYSYADEYYIMISDSYLGGINKAEILEYCDELPEILIPYVREHATRIK